MEEGNSKVESSISNTNQNHNKEIFNLNLGEPTKKEENSKEIEIENIIGE